MISNILWKILVICIISNIVNVYSKRNHQTYQQPSPEYLLSVDANGNCQVPAYGLTGRCLRFHDCPPAVSAWQERHIPPVTCSFHSPYDHFVCCPIPLMPAPVQFSPRYVENPQQIRISEQECSNIYMPARRRSKRETGATQDLSVDIVEEEIQKKSASFTEVVGGLRTHENEFPYMCALGWRSTSSHYTIVYNCGCVLIDRKYVLTAAHCVGGESPSVVRVGGVNLDERSARVIKIKKIIQHPEYDANLSYNDIAIIKLEKSSRETPACIWNTETIPESKLIALGYGSTKFAGASSNSLLKIYLSVLTNQDCNSFYKDDAKLNNGLSHGQICAVDSNGAMDTCQGDSGGPLLVNIPKYGKMIPYVVGLTSFGERCGGGTPSVYTRLSYYINWIEDEVWK